MGKYRIIIVDDKTENNYLLRALLQGNGYEVETATNGAEALDMARKNPPDLIISDILMPVMDGFALCREWMKDPRLKSIPFVFYTATYTDDRDRKFALSIGAEQFIVKPQEPDVLIASIREIIRQEVNPSSAQAKPETDLEGQLPAKEESVYLKQYNEALIRKLEDKMEQLEKTNRQLEQDIAARKEANLALQESEERHRLLFDTSMDAILLTAPDGTIFAANRAACRIFGRTEEEIVRLGRNCIVDTSDPRLPLALEERSLTGKFSGELGLIRKDGSIFPAEISSSIYKDKDGHLRTSMIIRDISERKLVEEEHERLRAQLVQAQKMEAIGRLAGGVAHDFNNMLTAILGHAEIAMGKVGTAQPIIEDLQEIQKAASRSADLTRQLLAFARKQTITPKVLELNATVEKMLKMLRRLIGENIELAWMPGENLWPIKMDASQLDQILTNLCVNARDAISGPGKVTIGTENAVFDEAYCATREELTPGEFVVLTVSDNGCGMDNETLTNIFEPFFTTKTIGKGIGMGMATVYGIVKQNNGFIGVSSEPGKGATFKICLPRHEGKAEKLKSKGPAAPITQGHETILLVEDEKAILKMTKTMLEGFGYRVLAAETPGEAFRLAEKHNGDIHLLITDVVMPEMNGRDLARNLMTLYPNLKRLFMSGYTANVIASHGVLVDGIHFIQKPFSSNDLADKVRSSLDIHRPRRKE
ncbi:MAG TPA: hypothetical protein DCZ94_04685 [Lentisphaeria bacterium]|nr:MAG: hypothetical protein A2X48_20085 [Lentisphaerae bacterium GWF2_49_21]HBC86232.1 hypothetical protein [Lentisphaeria bacterium]